MLPSETEQNHLSGQLPWLCAAVWLGGGFLLFLLAMAVFTAADFARNSNLEKFSESTAAGDVNFFQVPASSEPVFLWQRKQYVLAGREKVKIDDTDMIRVGQEETGDYVFYSPKAGPEKGLFVKIQIGEFLPIRPR